MSRAEDLFQKLVYFGEDAIDEFIVDRQTEELFLDFKRGNSLGKTGFTSLHKDDRKNLAKCISGFGNSEGGIVVWGVDCSRDVEIGDVAKAKVKIKNVRRFLSWLENAISGCVIPAHNKVRNHIIGEDKNGDGFIVTLIAKSEFAPHMTTMGSTYYIRSGSSNVPAPHSVIAGMFGKRPQPNLEMVIADKSVEIINNKGRKFENLPEKYVSIKFGMRGINESNAIARELFLTCNNKHKGGKGGNVRFYNFGVMEAVRGIIGHLSLISPVEFRLPPRAMINFANVEIILDKDVDDDFIIEAVVGAENSRPKDFQLKVEAKKLKKIVSMAFKKNNNKQLKTEIEEMFFENVRLVD